MENLQFASCRQKSTNAWNTTACLGGRCLNFPTTTEDGPEKNGNLRMNMDA
jgi:hypothetical protein